MEIPPNPKLQPIPQACHPPLNNPPVNYPTMVVPQGNVPPQLSSTSKIKVKDLLFNQDGKQYIIGFILLYCLFHCYIVL